MDYLNQSKEMLKGWIGYSLKDLYICPDRQDLICYGAGYNGWGIQTHQKALAVFATLAAEENLDMSDMSISKEELLDCSLKMLRFMLESHIEGDYHCTEGDKWGHTWISVLGTERTMHGIERLMDHMTVKDKALLRKVLISEADWIMDCYDICAHEEGTSGKNRPESNIWNGAFLHRTAMMYPDCERYKEYKEKGTKYLVNGISVPSDAYSKVLYDGKPVSEWFVGNNFFSSYSLDHHAYLNVGYMVICLSNAAMFHFSCKKYGVEPPKALYHHTAELWKLIKTCIFEDGRLIRIGGDSRVRYCYCQDYLLPAFLFVRDFLGDSDCGKLEEALVALFYKEYQYNEDGSFLSKRCESFRFLSPIYYTRLESDKAAVLSMLIDWSSMTRKGENTIERLTSWHEPFHGACIERGKKRFASWTWKGAQGAQGLCLPAGKSNFAEWEDNLAGEIKGMTYADFNTECIAHTERLFEGGFITTGTINRLAEQFVAEQQKPEVTATVKTVFAALPDDATTVVMQYAYTHNRTYLKTVKGLKLNIPNDVYNDFTRTYFYDNLEKIAEGVDGNEKVLTVHGNWINIDNALSVIKGYGPSKLSVYRPGRRKTGIRSVLYGKDTENLCSDVVCGTLRLAPSWADKGEVLLDEGAVVIAGMTVKKTKELAEKNAEVTVNGGNMIRSVSIVGSDGKTYIVLSNFGSQRQDAVIHSKDGRIIKNMLTGAECNHVISLEGGDAEIITLEEIRSH